MLKNYIFIITFSLTHTFLQAQNLSLEAEARGVWMSREVIKNGPDFMYDVFRDLQEANFNRLFINVHYLGSTIYPSEVIESVGGPKQLSEFIGRDPLREAIEIGHELEFEVIAWFEYGLMAHYSASDTGNNGPIITAHPGWEAIMPDGQHWQTTEFGNFHWLDPAHPEVVQFLVDLFAEISTKYPDLDGIETDRIRYPSQDFSYSTISRSRYMTETANIDPVLINKFHPQWNNWVLWREQQTTNLARKIYQKIKTINPAILVSAAVAPPYMLYQHEKLQAWNVWADSGYVDVLEPMIYVDDLSITNQLSEAKNYVPDNFMLYSGLGFQSSESVQYQIEMARSLNFPGVTIWYSGDLTKKVLEQLRQSTFTEKTSLPHNDLIIDDSDLSAFALTGGWQSLNVGFRNTALVTESGDGSNTAQWKFNLLKSAPYYVYSYWPDFNEPASNATYKIVTSTRILTKAVDQKQTVNSWKFLLADHLEYRTPLTVELSNEADGRVAADAVRLVIPKTFKIIDLNVTDSMHIEIRFNRALNRSAAENSANYYLEPEVEITCAFLNQTDPMFLILQTQPMQKNQIYQLQVENLQDVFKVDLPSVSKEFNYNPALSFFIIDNEDANFKTFGTWTSENQNSGFYGSNYLIAEEGQGENRAQWWDFVGLDGFYEISVWYPRIQEPLAPRVQYRILHKFGIDTVFIDQNAGGGQWMVLGTFQYEAGNASSVLITNENSAGRILADAVRIRRVLKPSIISAHQDLEFPQDCKLYQNYPNPFNSKTVIRYLVGVNQDSPREIDLSIYNSLGQKISTLVSERQSAGIYDYFWEGRDQAGIKVSTGIYIYQLQVGNHCISKKMIFLN